MIGREFSESYSPTRQSNLEKRIPFFFKRYVKVLSVGMEDGVLVYKVRSDRGCMFPNEKWKQTKKNRDDTLETTGNFHRSVFIGPNFKVFQWNRNTSK